MPPTASRRAALPDAFFQMEASRRIAPPARSRAHQRERHARTLSYARAPTCSSPHAQRHVGDHVWRGCAESANQAAGCSRTWRIANMWQGSRRSQRRNQGARSSAHALPRNRVHAFVWRQRLKGDRRAGLRLLPHSLPDGPSGITSPGNGHGFAR
jgi:hypothetical protein